MFARTLLALLVVLGLVTGAPAFACGMHLLPEDCACCPVEETQPCCIEAPTGAQQEMPAPVASASVDLKLAVVPVMKVVGAVVESGGFQPAKADDRLGRVRARPVFERIGIRLI